MDEKARREELIHRAELKYFLTEDELTLPDSEREALLLERKLTDQGLLGEQDLLINQDVIRAEAENIALERNNNQSNERITAKDRVLGWLIAGMGGSGLFKLIDIVTSSDLPEIIQAIIAMLLAFLGLFGLAVLHEKFDILGDRTK